MKNSLDAFLEMIGYIIGLITFVSGICWMLIRGKLKEDIHSIWSSRMREYEDSKEEGREERRQSILKEITLIGNSLKAHEESTKEERKELVGVLNEIKLELNNNSKLQTIQEIRILNLEKGKK